MRINLASLKENLPAQESYLQGYTPGLFRAIDAAHHNATSAGIEWGGFTLDEAKQALDMAMYYESDESIEDNEYDDGTQISNTGNAIHEFLLSIHAISKIKKIQPEKAGDSVDFF